MIASEKWNISLRLQVDICKEASKYNFNLLQQHNFDLEALLNPYLPCILSNGSNFVHLDDLDAFLTKNPCWSVIKYCLSRGCELQLWPMSEEHCKYDVLVPVYQVKHISAKKRVNIFIKALVK